MSRNIWWHHEPRWHNMLQRIAVCLTFWVTIIVYNNEKSFILYKFFTKNINTKVGYAHNPVSRTYCCKIDLNSCFLFVFYSNKLLNYFALLVIKKDRDNYEEIIIRHIVQ
jgi:hypothetical protein